MRLLDMVSNRLFMNWNDQLLLALSILGGKKSPYRIVVVDSNARVEGIISGRRVLEVLLGRRGEALKIRKGIRGVLREPVNLFLDEAHHIFLEHTPPQTILNYMAENSIGSIVVVDEGGVFKGIVDELSLLSRLKGKVFNVKVEEVMSRTLHVTSPEASLLEAAFSMVDFYIRRLPVVVGEALVGILTVTDVLNHILMDEKYTELLLYDIDIVDVLKHKVQEVMSSTVISIDPQSDVGEAIDRIVENNVSGLPVVSSDGKLVGIVSRVDLTARLIKVKGVPIIFDMMMS